MGGREETKILEESCAPILFLVKDLFYGFDLITTAVKTIMVHRLWQNLFHVTACFYEYIYR